MKAGGDDEGDRVALPATCSRCRRPVAVSPEGGWVLDLIPPKGPGDDPLLILHDCRRGEGEGEGQDEDGGTGR